jgi:CheY-like chemotaxis protein
MARPQHWELDILAAEDTPSDIELFKMAVQRCGSVRTLQIVRDGEEVIAYLRGDPPFNGPERQVPNVLFMDLKMPRLTGFEVLQWLRNNSEYSVIPVIIMSSSALDEDVLQAYRLGANAYFEKPANFKQLEEILRTILNFWTHAKRPPVNAFAH